MHRIAESQNHRIVGLGRDLCGSSSPTLLPKQGHLQQAAQDLVQAGLEYLCHYKIQNILLQGNYRQVVMKRDMSMDEDLASPSSQLLPG